MAGTMVRTRSTLEDMRRDRVRRVHCWHGVFFGPRVPLRRPALRARVHLAELHLVGWSDCGRSRDGLWRLGVRCRVGSFSGGGIARFLCFRLRSAWRRCTRAVATRCMVEDRNRSASWMRDIVMLITFAKDVVAAFSTGASSFLRIVFAVILILR